MHLLKGKEKEFDEDILGMGKYGDLCWEKQGIWLVNGKGRCTKQWISRMKRKSEISWAMERMCDFG